MDGRMWKNVKDKSVVKNLKARKSVEIYSEYAI